MCKSAHKKLVREDIAWLDKTMAETNPHSLEGKHLRDIAICSVCLLYGEKMEDLCPNPLCKTYNRKENSHAKNRIL